MNIDEPNSSQIKNVTSVSKTDTNKDKHMKVTTHDDDDDDDDDDNDDDFDDKTESNDTHLRRKRNGVKKTDLLLQDGE